MTDDQLLSAMSRAYLATGGSETHRWAAVLAAVAPELRRRVLEDVKVAAERVIAAEWNEQRKLGACDVRSAVYGMLRAATPEPAQAVPLGEKKELVPYPATSQSGESGS